MALALSSHGKEHLTPSASLNTQGMNHKLYKKSFKRSKLLTQNNWQRDRLKSYLIPLLLVAILMSLFVAYPNNSQAKGLPFFALSIIILLFVDYHSRFFRKLYDGGHAHDKLVRESDGLKQAWCAEGLCLPQDSIDVDKSLYYGQLGGFAVYALVPVYTANQDINCEIPAYYLVAHLSIFRGRKRIRGYEGKYWVPLKLSLHNNLEENLETIRTLNAAVIETLESLAGNYKNYWDWPDASEIPPLSDVRLPMTAQSTTR